MTETLQTTHRLGLAFGGGGARGFAHIGILRYLEEQGIRPHVLSGASAGSLVAAFYADGYSPAEMLELFSSLDLESATTKRPSARLGGLLGTEPFVQFVRQHLRHTRIEDLPIPTRIVVTDTTDPRSFSTKVLTEGDLALSVVASCSFPLVLHATEIDGRRYSDGGILCNLPARILRPECDTLIGVNLSAQAMYDGDNLLSSSDLSLATLFRRAWRTLRSSQIVEEVRACDLVLESPMLTKFDIWESSQAQHIEQIGYDIARVELTPDVLARLKIQ